MDNFQPGSELGGELGRIRCVYCGANNFPTSGICWQCGRPLKAAQVGVSETVTETMRARAADLAVQPAPLESALAPKAAAALGMLFPYIGLPVGIIFLMLDDSRKTRIGWITIGWSLVGCVINGIVLGVLLVPALAFLKDILPHPGGSAPVGFPGLPNSSGIGAGLWFVRPQTVLFFSAQV